jgi:hypothetical protein
MPGIFEGLRIWIVGTLVILFYVSVYSLESTRSVNVLVPHAVTAIVLITVLEIVITIENGRKKADLGKRCTNSIKPLVMISPATERGLIQGHRLLELEQLPLQSLSCEPQLVRFSLPCHLNHHSGCGSPNYPSKPGTFRIVLQSLKTVSHNSLDFPTLTHSNSFTRVVALLLDQKNL